MDNQLNPSREDQSKSSKSDRRRAEFSRMIDVLELEEFQKEILKNRWLDQTCWFADKSAQAKRRMTQLRVIIIVGGILLPTLATLPFSDNDWIADWSIIIVSFIVAVSAGLEAFFKFGDLYPQYRESAELLKIEGWSFFALSGQYGRYAAHSDAFEKFTARVEDIIRRDVRTVVSTEEREVAKTSKELEPTT